MKTIVSLLAIFSLWPVVASAQSNEQWLTQGLVAFYPLDGNAADASGNGNNAVPRATIPTADRFGKANSALGFDGVRSYVEIPNGSAFKSRAFTISLWFNAAQYPGNTPPTAAEFLVSKGQNNFELHLGAGHASGIRFLPRMGPGAHWDTPAAAYALNRWHHLAVTYDAAAGTVGAFVDGQAMSLSGAGAMPVTPDNNANARLGMRSDGTLGFRGKLDDIRIYSRALSGEEAKRLFAYEGGTNAEPQGSKAIASTVSPTVLPMAAPTRTADVAVPGLSAPSAPMLQPGNDTGAMILQIVDGYNVACVAFRNAKTNLEQAAKNYDTQYLNSGATTRNQLEFAVKRMEILAKSEKNKVELSYSALEKSMELLRRVVKDTPPPSGVSAELWNSTKAAAFELPEIGTAITTANAPLALSILLTEREEKRLKGQAKMTAEYEQQKASKLAAAEVKVAAFYLKRAEGGDALSQYELGMRYLEGKGVEASREKGIEWLRKAASQGYEKAVSKLKNLNASGEPK